MTTKYKIIGGPSKFDIMLGLFDQRVLAFKTKDMLSGLMFVRVTTIQALDDNNHDAWSLGGFISDEDGRCPERRRCVVLFSSKDRSGFLDDLGPENEKRDLLYFERMSADSLRKQISTEREAAASFKDELDEYLKDLGPRDRLVLEAYAASKVSRSVIGIQLDHRLHVLMTSRGVGSRK